MSSFYANVVLQGPYQVDVVGFLNRQHVIAYVSATVKGNTVIYHEDLESQEDMAAALSAHFDCPALLCMNFGDKVLLYHLYNMGHQVDAYVSRPHEELETSGEAMPEGDAEVVAKAFGMEHATARVERVLRRPTHETKGYALAVNRHGELLRALGLPLFAAGTGFRTIEVGELPEGPGFDPAQLARTGGQG